MHTCLCAVYSLGHPATRIHRHTLLYARTLIFTPSFHPAHPHYPSVLTESFSRPGHCKCCLPNTDMLKDTPPLLTLFFFFFLTAPILYCSLHPHHSAALSLSSRWTWSQFSVCSALWCHSVNLLSASISWPELGWKVRKSTVKSTIHEKHKWEHWSLDSNNTGVYKGYHISATRGFMSLAQNSGPHPQQFSLVSLWPFFTQVPCIHSPFFFFTPVLRPRLCEPILHSWTGFKCLQRYCVVKVTFEQLFIWFYFYWARRGRLLP